MFLLTSNKAAWMLASAGLYGSIRIYGLNKDRDKDCNYRKTIEQNIKNNTYFDEDYDAINSTGKDSFAKWQIKKYLCRDAMLLIGYVALQTLGYRRVIKKCSKGPLLQGPQLEIAQTLAKRIGSVDHVKFIETDTPGSEYTNGLQVALTSCSPKFVMAHELIHVKENHSQAQLYYQITHLTVAMAAAEVFIDTPVISGTAILAYFIGIQAFSRLIEKETDILATNYLDANEIREGASYFLPHLDNKTRSLREKLMSILDTHPSHNTRIDYLNKIAQTKDCKVLSSNTEYSGKDKYQIE